ncbi:hypothetical protein B0T24DRAFT_712191 [Lasiosphaeria ovina]|uniref:Uncharacterized protein n=1 Tax=Lasiosphaeria ovina TaxID=92902 RepID=A0AAE0JVQ5_9PEZI|nr:hypothetical protein B0T24DRAFT_712191 [Lasiosphaeria ovina]
MDLANYSGLLLLLTSLHWGHPRFHRFNYIFGLPPLINLPWMGMRQDEDLEPVTWASASVSAFPWARPAGHHHQRIAELQRRNEEANSTIAAASSFSTEMVLLKLLGRFIFSSVSPSGFLGKHPFLRITVGRNELVIGGATRIVISEVYGLRPLSTRKTNLRQQVHELQQHQQQQELVRYRQASQGLIVPMDHKIDELANQNARSPPN